MIKRGRGINVSEDEVVGVWLKREFTKEKWQVIKNNYLNTISDKHEKWIINSIKYPDYNNKHQNRVRLKILWLSRFPLLLPCLKASWSKFFVDKDCFKKLKVIRASSWDVLSNFCGSLEEVAKNVKNRPLSFWDPNREVVSLVRGIKQLINSKKEINTNLIIICSHDKSGYTILEGNKTAVALFNRYFLENKKPYRPLQVFLGRLPYANKWQW